IPLQEISRNTFRFAHDTSRAGQSVVFSRGANGRATKLVVEDMAYARRNIEPELGANQLRVSPVRPVKELLKEAQAAQPPKEEGDFRKSDLVELIKLDPTIKLETRYAAS